jgi:nucleotide-binding universal stress UspA family protein
VSAVRRIVVGVHGSLGSLQALRWAADEARERHVPLVPVIAWVPPGGDLSERGHPSPYLRRIWTDAARERLMAAFEAGLGGLPSDVEIADQPGDLLVIGTGRRSVISRALRKSVGRYCLAHAKCPVLAVPPSALMDEMTHPSRPWSLRGRHATVPDISELSER